MFEYLSNWMGYAQTIGLAPTRSDSSLESRLKNWGVYDEKLSEFQFGVASTASDMLQGISLPETIDREQILARAVRSSTDYLKKRPNIVKSLENASFREASSHSLKNLRILIDDYRTILVQAETKDIDLLLKSDLPASFFNDSILAYRSLSWFLDQEYLRIRDYVNRKLVIYRSNQPKLGRKLNELERIIQPEVESYRQLLVHHGRLRLYVNGWNASNISEMYNLDALHVARLDKATYEELNHLFKVNLFLFDMRFQHPIQRPIDTLTVTMWKELIDPLAAQ